MATAAPAAAAASVAQGGRSPAAGITGFIGIGNMGLAMALRLRELAWPVRVRDLDASREAMAARAGATACATPAALAAGCARVVIAVVDAAQSEDVLFGPEGAASALGPGSAVLLCPTIAPQSSEAIAARLAAIGIDCLDAPMSGGPARARDGSMSLMVACPDAVFARHRDLLETLSSKVFRVGTRAGDGARTKLVNNLLAAINLAGAAEALALAERVGLDPSRTLAVIEQSSGQSWIGSDRLPRALAGDLAPRAHTALLTKDAALAVSMAGAAGFETRLGHDAADVFARACGAGWGAFDDGALLDFLRGVDAPAPISATPLALGAARPSRPALDSSGCSSSCQRAARGLPGTGIRSQEQEMANPSPQQQDIKRIDIHDDAALREWSKKLDATPEELREAVGAVGDHADDVEMHLKGSRSSTNAERVQRES